MKPVTVSVDVARPTAEVFAFIADVENNPRWQRGMQSCRWTSPPPHREGASYDQVAHFLGRDVVSSFRVTSYDDGHRIRFTSTSGPFPIQETRTVDAAADGRARV